MSDYPTQDQQDTATNHGIEYALAEIASGATEPRESPLSGEWADDLIDRDVAFNAGWPNDAPEEERDDWQTGVTALADAWETGYNGTWASHLNEQDEELCTKEHDPLPYYSKITGENVAKASVWGSRPSTRFAPRRQFCQNSEHYA